MPEVFQFIIKGAAMDLVVVIFWGGAILSVCSFGVVINSLKVKMKCESSSPAA
jgi:hypothetical protein